MTMPNSITSLIQYRPPVPTILFQTGFTIYEREKNKKLYIYYLGPLLNLTTDSLLQQVIFDITRHLRRVMIVVLFLAPCRVFLEPARGSIFRRLRVCPLQAKLRCCGCYIISKFQYANKFFLRVPLLLLLLLFVVKASLHCFFTENGQIFLLQLALGQAFEALF